MCNGVVAEVLFQADEDYGNAGAAFENFGVPDIVLILATAVTGKGVYEAHHFVVMLCKESGLEVEKAMRMTWAWLYANGRRRS